jgi:hypothetical protein
MALVPRILGNNDKCLMQGPSLTPAHGQRGGVKWSVSTLLIFHLMFSFNIAMDADQ